MVAQLALERSLQRRIKEWTGLVTYLVFLARGVLNAHMFLQFLDCFKSYVAFPTKTCTFIWQNYYRFLEACNILVINFYAILVETLFQGCFFDHFFRVALNFFTMTSSFMDTQEVLSAPHVAQRLCELLDIVPPSIAP